jgi:hypothetical protein
MQLYWLCYQHNNQISVVIEPAPSLIHARLRASLAELDEGIFTEGHELDRKTEKQIPEGDNWTTIIAAGGEAVVGEVRPPEQHVTDLIE